MRRWIASLALGALGGCGSSSSGSTDMGTEAAAKGGEGSLFNNITVAANGIDADVLAPLGNAAATQAVVAGSEVIINSAKDIAGKKLGMTSGAGV